MSQAEDREALRMGIGIFLSARLAPFERTALKRFRGKGRLEYDMISDLIDQLIGCGSSAEIALRAETYFARCRSLQGQAAGATRMPTISHSELHSILPNI